MDEADLSEFKDEIKPLAPDLLGQKTLVTERSDRSTMRKILFYGHAEIGGDMLTVLNNPSPLFTELCNSLLQASAVNQWAVWNFILNALR
jgi:hypothetical protein